MFLSHTEFSPDTCTEPHQPSVTAQLLLGFPPGPYERTKFSVVHDTSDFVCFLLIKPYHRFFRKFQ